MHDLDLLVPYALVDRTLAAELLRGQSLPNLERFMARGTRTADAAPTSSGPLTTWQSWVFAARSGTPAERVNVAELWAMACGIAPAATGGRWVGEPAHFTVANDHLRLDDPRALDITLDEARALADAIAPMLVEAGWRLAPLEPATRTHWMLSRDDAAPLSAAAIDCAIGDNVAAWQPRSPDDAAIDHELAWRRLVNELQMAWFAHPVNEAREANGRATVNTLWLSGNGAPASPLPRYSAVDSTVPLLAALPVDPTATRALETFDGFVGPARHEDWSGWREQLVAFDAWIGHALRRQADGTVGAVTLVLCGHERTRVATVARAGLAARLRSWWPRGATTSLADAFAEEADA